MSVLRTAGGTTTPIPDPTELTTDQLRRELASLRDVIETRMDAMDRAERLLHDNLTRIPTDVDRQVTHLKETSDEKFSSIQLQFVERDVRSKAAEIAAQVAVGAALQAQKEAAAAQNDANAAAITKSELSVVKQIDGILALLGSNTKAIDEKITAINSRLDRGEGMTRGGQDFRAEKRLDTGTVIAVVAVAVAAVAVLLSVLHVGQQPQQQQAQQPAYLAVPSAAPLTVIPPTH